MNRAWISLVLIFLSLSTYAEYPDFDRGPDLQDDMQRELIEIIRDMPYLPGISEQLQVLVPDDRSGKNDGQKMRPDFGAMPIRGFLTPNSVSVLVIGQDGTHIAEGANRPGIAGFGGRVQDMLLHFGIYEGVLFTNLYVNTISGQYGSRSTPVVVKDKNKIQFQNVIENRQWLLTHEGPYGVWRNRFISWILRNNLDSLKMVMMLGQAGKDAGANFINSIGGVVSPRPSVGNGANLLVPVFKMVNAGGNNEFAMALTAKGEDVAEVLRRDSVKREALLAHLQPGLAEAQENFDKASTDFKAGKITKKRLDSTRAIYSMWSARVKAAQNGLVDYSDGNPDTGEGATSYNAEFLLTRFSSDAVKLMAFTKGGPMQNGVLYPEQFGGWDLSTMTANGKKTRSIKGLKISCYESQVGPCKNANYVVAPDVVFVGAPHPTSLSMGEQTRPGSAAESVERELIAPLRQEQARGWVAPQPEPGLKSPFLEDPNQKYAYGRGVIPPSHGDPGITNMRLLPVSTAKRMGGGTIVIGTRDRVEFDQALITKLQKDMPANQKLLSSRNVLTGRPKFSDWLEKYDRGPDQVYSKLLFQSLDPQKILMPKDQYSSEYSAALKMGLERARKKNLSGDEAQDEAFQFANNDIFNKYGIDAYNFKSHPEGGFFGHYRGTFVRPKVVIISDPVGYDSFITSKAATGDRGQYLHGVMEDLKVGDQYLVISTVPMMMEGADAEEWAQVLQSTLAFRTQLIEKIFSDSKPALVFADGKYAAAELRRLGHDDFIEIAQTPNPRQDVIALGRDLARNSMVRKFVGGELRTRGVRADIPRTHLTWIARTWEGTSGDRVITATDKGNKGKAYAIVAPNWARFGKVNFTKEDQTKISDLINRLIENGEPGPKENVIDFVERRSGCATKFERNNRPLCHLDSLQTFEGTLLETGSY